MHTHATNDEIIIRTDDDNEVTRVVETIFFAFCDAGDLSIGFHNSGRNFEPIAGLVVSLRFEAFDGLVEQNREEISE